MSNKILYTTKNGGVFTFIKAEHDNYGCNSLSYRETTNSPNHHVYWVEEHYMMVVNANNLGIVRLKRSEDTMATAVRAFLDVLKKEKRL